MYTLVEGITLVLVCKYLVLVILHSIRVYSRASTSRKTITAEIKKVAMCVLPC